MKFKDFDFTEEMLQGLDAMRFEEPTPVQEHAIPIIQKGKDVIAVAQTGTGKTASFMLPLVEILSTGQSKSRMPRSLILAPTRELAMQVSEDFKLFNKYLKLQMALLIGGVSFSEQDSISE